MTEEEKKLMNSKKSKGITFRIERTGYGNTLEECYNSALDTLQDDGPDERDVIEVFEAED